jgi:hypothetical protein
MPDGEARNRGIGDRRREDATHVWNRIVSSVPTGVDVEYFASRGAAPPLSDMVFCGSMDWLPNVDAVEWFLPRSSLDP